MGLTKKSDGRYVVGKGIEDGNEYKGSAAWRDMVIQYSGDGATEKSLEYLTFLKDYALYHSAQGNPVIPPNVQIWMSTANTMKAVEADDITVDGETVKIGACTWDGSAWSFSEPTPGGGGSSLPQVTSDDNGDVLAVVGGEWAKTPAPSSLPPYTSADKGKVLTLGDGSESETVIVVPEQTVTILAGGQPFAILTGADDDYLQTLQAGATGKLNVDGTEYDVTATTNEQQAAFVDENNTYAVMYVTGVGSVFGVMGGVETNTSFSVSLTTSDPKTAPKWEDVDQNLVYYPLDGVYYFSGLSVGEAYEMFQNGKIPYVISPILGVRMLTLITESDNLFSVYYNFSSTSLVTNLQSTDKLPYSYST